MQNKHIITMGDPRGIGPDLILITQNLLGEQFNPIVIGSKQCLKDRAKQLNLPKFQGDVIEPPDAPKDYEQKNGKSAISYLNYATNLLSTLKVGFLLTCPINKKSMQDAGFEYPGHTEYLAARSGTENFHMLMAGTKLKVLLTTIHEPLSKVPSLLSIDLIKQKIYAAFDACFYDFNINKPTIAVAGLNPHAGEEGLFGREEINIIKPAIREAQNKLLQDGFFVKILGPFPPDTIFWEGLNNKFDMIIAMYHDQGLAPIKTIDFFSTVNVTLGLPYVRTSPDHGTAYNLVGTGNINPDSFIAAWNLGLKMQANRIKNQDNFKSG